MIDDSFVLILHYAFATLFLSEFILPAKIGLVVLINVASNTCIRIQISSLLVRSVYDFIFYLSKRNDPLYLFASKLKYQAKVLVRQRENHNLQKNYNRSIHLLEKDEIILKQNVLLEAMGCLFLWQIKASLAYTYMFTLQSIKKL